MGPVIEGTGPNLHHPQYGEVQRTSGTRPVRGGSIDVADVMGRAGVCWNLEARKADNGSINEENIGKAEEDTPGEVRVPMGGADKIPHSGVGSVRGLPIGVVNGRSPVTLENETYTNGKRKVRLEIPLTLPRDGRGYTKCSPLAATLGFGERQLKCLMDPDSNTSIVDLKTLRACYPDASINESVQMSVHGVGKASTMGWVVLPVTLTAKDAHGPVDVELDVEFHVMQDFTPGLLLGLDTMLDYDIDLCLSRLEGSVREYKFALDAPYRPFRSVLVKAAKKVTVPGRTATVVPVQSAMVSGFDYIIDPFYTAIQGVMCGPQLPKGVADSTLDKVVYVNDTDHPLVLDKHQAIARATMATVDTRIVETTLRMDWADMVKPSTRVQDVGAKPPAAFDLDELQRTAMGSSTAPFEAAQGATWFTTDRCYEDELCFSADGREKPRRPRSIPDADAARIAAAASQRKPSDEFAVPLDDPEMEIPSVEIPDGTLETILDSDFMIDPGLDDDRRQDLLGLLRTYVASFSKGTRLGKVRGFKATIPLKEGSNAPPPQPNRPQGPAKRQVVDEFIDQMLSWDVIEDSSSPTSAGIVLVKQNGKWRFCVDFRMLNEVTVGDSYPMLRADYVFSAMGGKRFFSTLDCLKGYHQLELDEKDRWKSAFITHRGLYQFKRLPFGLKNAPAIYQRFMDQLLGSLRWVAALVYIDDVIIYSETWPEHMAHLRQLLKAAAKCGLTFSLPKCRFGFTELTMLGLGLSRYGLHTIKDRVRAVLDLAAPTTMGELHRLLGMFGYYRMFIRNFAKVTAPLNELKKRDPDAKSKDYSSKLPIPWTDACQAAYDELKHRLSSAPILAHPRYDRPFILYTDASNISFGAVLAQVWTREDYVLAADDGSESASSHVMEAEFDWNAAYSADKVFRAVYARLRDKPQDASDPEDPNFFLHADGLMRFHSSTGDRVCLPASSVKDTLYVAHDALGHFGFEKTYDRVAATYYRPGLSSLVKQYVQFCPQCLKNKTSRSKKQGELMSIDAPSAVEPSAFRSINMDLIVNLPPSGGYDAILVIVDRCTKAAIFVPTVSSYTAEMIAELLFDNVVRRGFIPEKIITDRDPKITKSFWKTLARRLNLKHSLTAAWHAQTDGAAERLNQTLETAIRAYVSPQLDNWHASLPMLELAYNTAKNASTSMSPFDLLYVQPQNVVERLLGISDRDPTDNLQAQDFVENARNRLKDAREAVTKSLRLQKLYYDRRHGPIRPIEVGDFVSIRLADHPVSLVKRTKLTQQKLPPYKVLEVLANKHAVRLDIPPQVGIHPVLSVQHVDRAVDPSQDPFQRSNHEEPPAVDVAGDRWEGEIRDERSTRSGQKRYLVHWIGWDERYDEWLPSGRIDQGMIDDWDNNRRALNGQLAQTFLTETPFQPKKSYETVIPQHGPIERPVLYISRSTKPYEQGYQATELEITCLHWAFAKLHHYLEGSDVLIITDHESINGILNSSPGTIYSGRLDKVRMALMPYMDKIKVVYKPGSKMQNVDPLSRAPAPALDADAVGS
jgi:hypothetical protein